MKHLKLILLCVIYSLAANSQTYDFNGIKRLNLKDISAIIENNEVKGYYAFYFLEKVSKNYLVEVANDSFHFLFF